MPYYYERTEDVSLIESVLFDSEMFSRISEDGQLIDDINIEISSNHLWVALYHNEILLGIGWIHPLSIATGMIHIHVSKQHRSHSYQCGMMMLDAMLSLTQHNKFNAEIPIIYRDVIKFTQKMGFQIEGTNRQSVYKNGQLVDQIYLGCTRSEMQVNLKQLNLHYQQ